jgi:hypothetical protein
MAVPAPGPSVKNLHDEYRYGVCRRCASRNGSSAGAKDLGSEAVDVVIERGG